MFRQSKMSVIIVVILVVMLAVLGLIFGISQFGIVTRNSDLINVQKVKTYTNSAASGEAHSLQATFHLEVEKNKSKNVDSEALYNKINDIISNLDYDKIAGEDGTKYIKNEIANNISEFVDPQDLKAVYISDIISDAKLEEDTPPKDRRDDVFKGLFENIK